MNGKLEEALRYAELGLRVLPCWPVRDGKCACGRPTCTKSAGKHPLSALVPRGVKDASSDPATVRAWWEGFPDANPAVATGEGSGVFVLDVDTKDNGEEGLLKLQEEHGEVPQTLVARTPSGGLHVWFAHPGAPVKNSVRQLGSGLDVRGDGGYVVAPPSETPSGTYEWLASEAPPQAPGWLVGMVTGQAGAPLDPLEFSELMNGIPEGRRDIVLFRWACKLRAVGIPLVIAEEVVTYGARKCDPPFPEEDARDKLRRAYANYRVEFPLTDMGNAERMVHRHGERLRFSLANEWLIWNGQRWEPDRNGILVFPYAQDTIKSVELEARELVGEDEVTAAKRGALLEHYHRCSRTERLEAMLRQARTDPVLVVQADELDADPWLLNVQNGTIDLRTGRLYHHSQEDLITKVAGTAFSPEAEAPTWLTFLERVQPDPEIRAFLQRAAGYSLTGSVQEQVMFFMHGSGRNGKSTFANALLALLGDYGTMGTPDLLLADRSDSHPTGLADLTGVRYVPTIEIEQGKRLAEANFKWITGGDTLKARRMHQDYYEFKPQFKLWMAANHKPVVRGEDNAVWRRILLVPFEVTIPEEEKDPLLGERLLKELPGILNWCLEGCTAWRTGKLAPPEQVLAATQEYRSEQDVLGQFVAECLEPDEGALPSDRLYSTYRAWARDNGINYPMSKVALTRRLKELGWRDRPIGSHRIAWEGWSLSSEGARYNEGSALETVIDTRNAF